MPSISASVTGLLDAHADALAREVVSDLIKNPRTPRRAAGPGVHDRGVLRSGGLLSPARIRDAGGHRPACSPWPSGLIPHPPWSA